MLSCSPQFPCALARTSLPTYVFACSYIQLNLYAAKLQIDFQTTSCSKTNPQIKQQKSKRIGEAARKRASPYRLIYPCNKWIRPWERTEPLSAKRCCVLRRLVVVLLLSEGFHPKMDVFIGFDCFFLLFLSVVLSRLVGHHVFA